MKRGPYVCLSAIFTTDDDIVAVGERAAWLYLAMTGDCRMRRTDGWISRDRVSRLGIAGWSQRLVPLLNRGLVEQHQSPQGEECYWIPGYLKWNKSEAQLTAAGKYGACRRYHPQPCEEVDCVASKRLAFDLS